MSRYQPALLGGVFIGVLSALPFVRAGNICCCLWVVVGGLLTVYLQQQSRPEPVEAGEAILGGLLAGVVGTLVYMLLFVGLFRVSGAEIEEQVRAALDQNPQMPPEARNILLNVFSGGSFVMLLTLVTLPVYAVFSMLGALLGLAVFKKKPTAPPPAAIV